MQMRVNVPASARKGGVRRRGATAKQIETAQARRSPLRLAVEALGESWHVVRKRLARGATLEQALCGPRRSKLPRCEHCGQAVRA